ncbi:KGG domain-containing protein [Anaerofustis sp. NSJ-163]|uniref:KGG domain-containing protein n=1 Tax=Anaerofustis sp. NSJ-163 TaxID=2944391 RepID=UPI00209BF113|nr:KGG domain-containing protein [Anaerofustis sp. NSJ-163]MCO8194411.1 KGG domain-containing protein [Anaerofustis sp. NSJ-163]
MSKENNLIPLNERTKEEQREIARKGGIASGKARRKKKLLRQILDEIGESRLNTNEAKDIAKALSINKRDVTYDVAIMFKAVSEALGGNIKAMEFIRDTRGQNNKNDNGVNIDITIPVFKGEDDLE